MVSSISSVTFFGRKPRVSAGVGPLSEFEEVAQRTINTITANATITFTTSLIMKGGKKEICTVEASDECV